MFLKTLRWPMMVIGLTAFMGSVQARDRGWEASPSVWSLYNQGNIPGACWEAYDKDRQWRWMLFCVDHFVVNSKFKDAELFFGNAYHSALDWAEYGWAGGIKKGCDRHWGIMGLRHVANSTAAIDGGLIRQQANNELGRIISQNPPKVLHGPWSVIGPSGGRLDLRQNGSAFEGTEYPQSGQTNIQYNRNAPFRWDANRSLWVGDYWWYYYSGGRLFSSGRGVVSVDDNNSCHPTLDQWTYDPKTGTYGSVFKKTLMRP